MGVFQYCARDSGQRRVSGTLTADTARIAREKLRQQGLLIEQFQELLRAESGGGPSFFARAASPIQLVRGIQDLSMLLGVGISLAEALDLIIQQQRGKWRSALQQVQQQVTAGATLGDAFRSQPETFDALTVQLVEVGESAGNLDEVLIYLSEYKEQALAQRDKVWSAMLYPCVVLGASVCVSIFLMTAIVPPLLDNLISAGRPLPLPTRWLKWLSDGFLHYGHWLAVLTSLIIAGVVAGFRTVRGRWARAHLLLRIPLFGELIRMQSVARCVRILAVLLRSGMELPQALAIGERSLGNLVLSRGLENSRQAISSGLDLGPALARSGVFPPLAVQVFAVGQQSGQLEEMLEKLARDYERHVTSMTQRAITLLEPMLIIVLSVVVGFILFATVLPILEAGNVL